MKRYPVGSRLTSGGDVFATIVRSDGAGLTLRYSHGDRDYPWESLNTWLRWPHNRIILPFNEYINAVTN